jgi:hypothetical protein
LKEFQEKTAANSFRLQESFFIRIDIKLFSHTTAATVLVTIVTKTILSIPTRNIDSRNRSDAQD